MNFFVNEAMGIGNSGVEHAQFYRAKRFDQVQIPYKFVFMGLIDNLHEAMDKWNLRDDQVINLWEYLVFGDEYMLNGISKRVTAEATSTTVDSTNTTRMNTTLTSANMRITKHFIKYPNPKKEGHLLVSVNRVELYDDAKNKRKVMYEEVRDPHGDGAFEIRNIHVFDQPERLFFPNVVQLRRYFFHQIEKLYPGKNTFILDRGEPNEVALMDDEDKANRKIVAIVHADHLSDRKDPRNPLWNNFYEYTLSHLAKVDRLVVATKLQREDLLIDFPNDQQKIVTIPVGGVSNTKTVVSEKKPHRELKLVTMSRLAEEKHVDLIVQAVINLREKGIKLSLDIYGAGGEDKKIKKLIEERKAEGYVELKGLTHHADQVYPQYDAFVAASYSEGFGLTYIEALNAGLPVVTFNARFGAMEMIRDGENGFALDFKRDDVDFNVKQLEKGIQKLTTVDMKQMQKTILESITDFRDAVIADKWRVMFDEL